MTTSSDCSRPPGSALRLYFDVLACVARADGRYADDERHLLEAAARACDLDPGAVAEIARVADPSQPLDMDKILHDAGSKADASVVVETLRDSYVLASVDNDISAAEVEVLERFLTHAGLDEIGRSLLLQWARTAAEHHLDGLRLIADLRCDHPQQ